MSGAEIMGDSVLNKKAVILFAILFWLMIIIISYFHWDIAIAYYCKKELSGTVRDIAQIITVWGDAKWYYGLLIIAFIIVYLIMKNKLFTRRVIYILFSLITTGIVNTAIKWLAGRHRPKNLFNHDLYGFSFFGVGYELTSFPSGHTSVVFCIATAISMLFPRLCIPVFITALIIGMSRVIITSHFLGDVIGGAGVGIIAAVVVKYYFNQKKIVLRENDGK
jgi:membrane-associated phospholipid phosphatase